MYLKLYLLLILIIVLSCVKQEKTFEVYKTTTVDGVQCELYYLKRNLIEIRHTKTYDNSQTLRSYTFYEDGNISTIRKVMGDSILYTTKFYPNGKIKYKKSDLDLNPRDTIIILHGVYKEYYENGSLRSIGRYVRGVKRDTFKYYDKQGYLEQIEVFDIH